MKKKKILVFLLLITIVMFMLLGCSSHGIKEIKLNANISKEYNHVIKVYNRLALSFTDLARIMDDEIQKPIGFDEGFWNKYSLKEEKVLNNKKKLDNYSFSYQKIKEIEKDLNPFMEDLEKYLEIVRSLKNEPSNISKEDFRNTHKELYEHMKGQSIQIVKAFDRIHDSIY